MRVFDIRRTPVAPKRQAVDANALFYNYYPSFHRLAVIDPSACDWRRLKCYAEWISLALKSGGGSLYTTQTTIGELAHVVEVAELRLLAGENFDVGRLKEFREKFQSDLSRIRGNTAVIVAGTMKAVALVPEPTVQEVIGVWQGSSADLSDAVLVASAMKSGITAVVSNDAAFLSFASIDLYTGNASALKTAEGNGSLMNPISP